MGYTRVYDYTNYEITKFRIQEFCVWKRIAILSSLPTFNNIFGTVSTTVTSCKKKKLSRLIQLLFRRYKNDNLTFEYLSIYLKLFNTKLTEQLTQSDT